MEDTNQEAALLPLASRICRMGGRNCREFLPHRILFNIKQINKGALIHIYSPLKKEKSISV